MEVAIKKSVLFNFLKKHLNENRTANDISGNFISPYDIKSEEDLIKPVEHMSVQLSVEAPPVEDPEFIPASRNELASASSLICHKVPHNQIDYFYRMLHKLLDQAVNRESDLLSEGINLSRKKETYDQHLFLSAVNKYLNNKCSLAEATKRLANTPQFSSYSTTSISKLIKTIKKNTIIESDHWDDEQYDDDDYDQERGFEAAFGEYEEEDDAAAQWLRQQEAQPGSVSSSELEMLSKSEPSFEDLEREEQRATELSGQKSRHDDAEGENLEENPLLNFIDMLTSRYRSIRFDLAQANLTINQGGLRPDYSDAKGKYLPLKQIKGGPHDKGEARKTLDRIESKYGLTPENMPAATGITTNDDELYSIVYNAISSILTNKDNNPSDAILKNKFDSEYKTYAMRYADGTQITDREEAIKYVTYVIVKKLREEEEEEEQKVAAGANDVIIRKAIAKTVYGENSGKLRKPPYSISNETILKRRLVPENSLYVNEESNDKTQSSLMQEIINLAIKDSGIKKLIKQGMSQAQVKNEIASYLENLQITAREQSPESSDEEEIKSDLPPIKRIEELIQKKKEDLKNVGTYNELPTLAELIPLSGRNTEGGVEQWKRRFADRRIKLKGDPTRDEFDKTANQYEKISNFALEKLSRSVYGITERLKNELQQYNKPITLGSKRDNVVRVYQPSDLIKIIANVEQDIERFVQTSRVNSLTTDKLARGPEGISRDDTEDIKADMDLLLFKTKTGEILRFMKSNLFKPFMASLDRGFDRHAIDLLLGKSLEEKDKELAQKIKEKGLKIKGEKGSKGVMGAESAAHYFTGKKNKPVFEDHPTDKKIKRTESAQDMEDLGIDEDLFEEIYNSAQSWFNEYADESLYHMKVRSKSGEVEVKHTGDASEKIKNVIKKMDPFMGEEFLESWEVEQEDPDNKKVLDRAYKEIRSRFLEAIHQNEYTQKDLAEAERIRVEEKKARIADEIEELEQELESLQGESQESLQESTLVKLSKIIDNFLW